MGVLHHFAHRDSQNINRCCNSHKPCKIVPHSFLGWMKSSNVHVLFIRFKFCKIPHNPCHVLQNVVLKHLLQRLQNANFWLMSVTKCTCRLTHLLWDPSDKRRAKCGCLRSFEKMSNLEIQMALLLLTVSKSSLPIHQIRSCQFSNHQWRLASFATFTRPSTFSYFFTPIALVILATLATQSWAWDMMAFEFVKVPARVVTTVLVSICINDQCGQTVFFSH